MKCRIIEDDRDQVKAFVSMNDNSKMISELILVPVQVSRAYIYTRKSIFAPPKFALKV